MELVTGNLPLNMMGQRENDSRNKGTAKFTNIQADNVMGSTAGLWENAPGLCVDPSYAYILFDDFLTGVTTGTNWYSKDDGGTGTNAYQDVAGGALGVVTAAADNDYHAMMSMGQCFQVLTAKKLWFEARFKLTEATTNESAWWFGLTNTDTTGGLQANAAGPLASYDGVLIWKDEATMTIDAETSNAGTQDTATAIATFTSATWTRVGFYIDDTETTANVYIYVDTGDGNGLQMLRKLTLTRAGTDEMDVVFGVKAGPTGAAETLVVDYVKCVQLR